MTADREWLVEGGKAGITRESASHLLPHVITPVTILQVDEYGVQCDRGPRFPLDTLSYAWKGGHPVYRLVPLEVESDVE
jgi:hypothetical protein